MLYLKVSILANLVFLICLPKSYGKLNKYCSICENHTMCKYQGLGRACENAGPGGVSLEEKKEIVDLHNWFRKIVAGGYETSGAGGGQPKAANMMKFYWDEDLAQVAQRWADQCRLEHDLCRDDARWKVGQNIYWKWKFPQHEVNWTESISSWFREVSTFNPRDVLSYRFDASTGHYTQMLWHDTYLIGCGRRDYGYNKLYVCNYGPTGNWIGESLYAVGEPCSRCPSGTSCNENLCDAYGTGINTSSHIPFVPNKIDKLDVPDFQRPIKHVTTGSKINLINLEPSEESTQEDNVILDEETNIAVAEIQMKIKNLLKKVIKKGKLQK